MNRIWHNYPSLIRCLRVFHILVYAYLLSRCYCYNHYKIPKTLLLLSLLLLPLPPLSYYFATKHFAAYTKFPGVVELTTQLLILENILWLPLCQINKFGLNTLPSKTVVMPYTCGLSKGNFATKTRNQSKAVAIYFLAAINKLSRYERVPPLVRRCVCIC